MPADFRLSPSGPSLGAFSSDLIENDSNVAGVSLTAALANLVNPINVRYFDDFLGGINTSTVNNTSGFGALRCSFQKTSTTSISKTAATSGGAIGCYNVSCPAGGRGGLSWGSNNSNQGTLQLSQIKSARLRVAPDSSTAQGIQMIGIGSTGIISAGNLGDGLYFQNNNPDAVRNWHLISRRNSIQTLDVDTGVPVGAPSSGFFDLLLRQNAAGDAWEALINNVLVRTIPLVPANVLPTNVSNLSLMGVVNAGGGATCSLVFDQLDATLARFGTLGEAA